MTDFDLVKLVIAGSYEEYCTWLDWHDLSAREYRFLGRATDVLMQSGTVVFLVGRWIRSPALRAAKRRVRQGILRWARDEEYPCVSS